MHPHRQRLLNEQICFLQNELLEVKEELQKTQQQLFQLRHVTHLLQMDRVLDELEEAVEINRSQ